MPHSIYLPERMGSAVISPTDPVEAGSFQILHPDLYRRIFRHRRHRLDQGGAPLRQRHGTAAMERSASSQLHDGGGLERRGAGGAGRRQAQHPPLGQDPVHPRHPRLPARGRHDHRALRRPTAGSPGMRVQTFVEPTFEFRVLADPFAMYNYVELPVQPFVRHRGRAAGRLEGDPSHAAPLRRGVPPRLQGRGRMGQSRAIRSTGVFMLRANRPVGGSPAIRSQCGAANTRCESRRPVGGASRAIC